MSTYIAQYINIAIFVYISLYFNNCLPLNGGSRSWYTYILCKLESCIQIRITESKYLWYEFNVYLFIKAKKIQSLNGESNYKLWKLLTKYNFLVSKMKTYFKNFTLLMSFKFFNNKFKNNVWLRNPEFVFKQAYISTAIFLKSFRNFSSFF